MRLHRQCSRRCADAPLCMRGQRRRKAGDWEGARRVTLRCRPLALRRVTLRCRPLALWRITLPCRPLALGARRRSCGRCWAAKADCMGPHGCRCWGQRREIMRNGEKDRRFYLTREPVILTALSALAVVYEIRSEEHTSELQ